MEKFIEILKDVLKFLAIFMAKIVYYFVKGCIAVGKYCVLGFNYARKYVEKFIREKQWEVVTSKLAKAKTPKWNQTRKDKSADTRSVESKEAPWMRQTAKPTSYTPEESMDEAYRVERKTTPVVDPGNHANKNKVAVKAVEDMASFNGAVVVKEVTTQLLPTHAPVAEEHKEETIVNQVQDDTMVVNDADVEVSNGAEVVNDADVEVPNDAEVVNDTDVDVPNEAEVANEVDVVVQDDVMPAQEDEKVAQDEEAFAQIDINEEPAHIDTFTNISFAEEEPVQEQTSKNQEEATPKISFSDISFVEPDEEKPIEEAVAEAPEVHETTETPEVAVAVEEAQPSDDDVLPFEPMNDALDFFDEPVAESPVQDSESTPADVTVIEDETNETEPEPAKAIVAEDKPSLSDESWQEYDLFKSAASKDDSADAPKDNSTKANSIDQDASDRYTEGSLFDF